MKKFPEVPQIEITDKIIKTVYCYEKTLRPYFDNFNKNIKDIHSQEKMTYDEKLEFINQEYVEFKHKLNKYISEVVGLEINFDDNCLSKGKCVDLRRGVKFYSKNGNKIPRKDNSAESVFNKIDKEILVNNKKMEKFFEKAKEFIRFEDFNKKEELAASFLDKQ